MAMFDFVRQSIASDQVGIEALVGLLVAKATIEGFGKKLGEKILERSLQDVQLVGSAVLKRLPWQAADRPQKLAAAQEAEGLQGIEAEVRSVLDDPALAEEIRPLLENIARVEQLVYKPHNSPTIVAKDNATVNVNYS
jgi:hypothetical protein